MHNVMHVAVTLAFVAFAQHIALSGGGFACLSNPCVHGVCVDDLNTTYACYCIDGYTGVQCQTNWDECWSGPCQNGGACTDGIAAFNCTCAPGFAGELCEENLNECLSNPCQNNATCVDAANGYVCNCAPGYAGAHCDLDIAVCNLTNETRCANGGRCVEGPGVTFYCSCAPGWTGALCELEVDECMAAPCENGGVCVDLLADYECACPFGFAGRHCEETVAMCEKNTCKNNALCLLEDDRSVCYCVPDYHGEQCQWQYDECQLSGNRCMNGGTCIDGVDGFSCSCPPKLTGSFCECLIVDLHAGTYLDCSYVATNAPIYNATISTEEMETTTMLTSTSTSTLPASTITTLSSTETTDATVTTTQVPKEDNSSTFTSPMEAITTDEITTSTMDGDFGSTTTMPSSSSSTSDIISSVSEEWTESTTELTTISSTNQEPSSTIVTTIDTTTEPNTTTMPDTTTYSSTSTTLTTEEEKQTTQESTTSPEIPTTEETTTQTSTTEFEEITTQESSTSSPLTTSTEDIRDILTTLNQTLLTTTESPSTTSEASTTITTESEPSTTTTDLPETSPSPSPSPPPFDCSQPLQRCQNGGTCIYAEGFYCACPYDYAGEQCESKLGIRTPAFNGRSYIVHEMRAQRNLEVAFSARTTGTSGVLFYATFDSTYMTLYMERAQLKFKFSCGYQTMLLSELNKAINNGYELRINALLTFSDDFTHCNASIRLNNTITMSGAQIARLDTFPHAKSYLYLGGLNENTMLTPPLAGFVGCMSNLSMLGKPRAIFSEALDAYGITECLSLACLANPCQNGGTCTPLARPVHGTYVCKCSNGYVGAHCERSVCENNPCRFGGTCLSFTGSGYICLCPFGKHGHFCENDLKISKAYYSSSVQGYASFTKHPLPRGPYKQLEVEFTIAPANREQIALLLFMGQRGGAHDYYADHLAVSYVKGYIMLTWNLGAGPRRIFTSRPLATDKASAMIHIGRVGQRAWLHVESLGNVTGRSAGARTQLDVEPHAYFGGYPSVNFHGLPHDLPLHEGFAGCIADVRFRIGEVTLALGTTARHVLGRAVGQCGTTECFEGVCQHHGACLYHGGTFTCLCQDGYYGPLCSTSVNLCEKNSCAPTANCVPGLAGYECDCPIGKKNKFCTQNETLSDISFTGVRSYAMLNAQHFEVNKLNLDMEMRPLKDGLILFIGSEESFISLIMSSGLLELRILPKRQRALNNDVIVVRSNKILRNGLWHQVKIQVYGRKHYLFVDNIVNTGMMQPGDVLDMSNRPIHLGGAPDLSQLPADAVGEFPTAFTGCMRKLFIGGHHAALNETTIVRGQNIIDCDGTPCGGDHCANGGTCWLDSALQARCHCAEPHYGARCELALNCTERQCKNDGYCLEGRCMCKVGYVGALCETGLTIRSPKFVGKSYLYVNAFESQRNNAQAKTESKKRNLFSYKKPSDVAIKFMTTSDGLLLFTNVNVLFTIGLHGGKLILGTNNESMELLSAPKVNDGLEHVLHVKFHPFRLYLDEDEYDVAKFNGIEFNQFYIGGIPANLTSIPWVLLDENEANPRLMFDGCIKSLTTNNMIGDAMDFNKFPGENVFDCSDGYF